MGLFSKPEDQMATTGLEARLLRLETTVVEFQSRLARLESGAHGVVQATPIGPQDPMVEVVDEVRRLVHQGQKIGAIKLYREHTGLGLKEAKDFVDRI